MVVDAYGNKLSGVAVNFTVDTDANIVATTISDKQESCNGNYHQFQKANNYTVKAE